MINPWDAAYYRIRQRCLDKNHVSYKNYGGRGILCAITKDELKKLWFRDKGYELSYPSIDRKNRDGNYEYKNCRFIECAENSGTRRNSTSKTCSRGHPLKGYNLFIRINGGYACRVCRKCMNLYQKKYDLRVKLKLTPKFKTINKQRI